MMAIFQGHCRDRDSRRSLHGLGVKTLGSQGIGEESELGQAELSKLAG